MIQITFTPETPEQAAVVAEAIGKYQGTVAAGETVAEVKEPVAKAVKPAKKAAPAPVEAAPEPAAEPAPAVEATSQVTLEEVRLVLANLSQGGKAAEVKSLIAQFKAAKLTEIPADKYAEVLAAAKEL
jgi:hypothetical protein